MKILFLTLIVCCFTVSAQPELNKKSISGAGIVSPLPTKPTTQKTSGLFKTPLNLPSITKPNLGFNKQTKFEIGKQESKVDLQNNTKFVNPNIEVAKRENEKFKQVDLGKINLNGNFVIVKFRDFSSPDGDMVRIMHNRESILFQVILEPYYKEVKINLIVGENKLEFLALNEGSGPPNTAEFEVLDENGKSIFANQWNLNTGETGVVIISKEK